MSKWFLKKKNVLFIECKANFLHKNMKIIFRIFNLSFRGFSNDKAIIIFNNHFFVVHPKHIEQKLQIESWKEGYYTWYLFKYKHFKTDMFDGCVYFTTWTHFCAIRVKIFFY